MVARPFHFLSSRYRLFTFGTFVVYTLLVSAFMVWQGIGILPDRYFLVLLVPVLLAGRIKSFLVDWVPFVLLLMSYDLLRALGPFVDARAHYYAALNMDLRLFHIVPPVWLQQRLTTAPYVKLLNGASTLLYVLHFALPLAFAYVLWVRNRAQFREFVVTLLVLSYVAWFTYIVFPAAPPWLASREGHLAGVKNLLSDTLGYFPERIHLPTLYTHLTANDVAAIPSLHAAYPVLVLLFAVRFFGRKGWLFTPYVLALWFSLVYLGEHYVTDILIGVGYAVTAFVICVKLCDGLRALPLNQRVTSWREYLLSGAAVT